MGYATFSAHLSPPFHIQNPSFSPQFALHIARSRPSSTCWPVAISNSIPHKSRDDPCISCSLHSLHTAMTGLRQAKRPRLSKPQSDDSSTSNFTCQVCLQDFERLDHLNRHLDSHRNERTFRCSECPKGFNRRDLLLRHQAAHTRNAAQGKVGPDRTADRAIVACDNCVVSKAKCDNGRPCQRCQKKSIDCSTKPIPAVPEKETPVSESRGVNMDLAYSRTTNPSLNIQEEQTRMATPIVQSSPVNPVAPDKNMESQNVHPSSLLQSEPYEVHDLYSDSINPATGFPSFFDQIMGSDFDLSTRSMELPPNISTYFPDQDWLGDNDIFGVDFTPTMNEILNDDTWKSRVIPNEATPPESTSFTTRRGSLQKPHTIMQRSPW